MSVASVVLGASFRDSCSRRYIIHYKAGNSPASNHNLLYTINVKKLQFNQVLTATCIEWHIENSKNDKKVILAIITSPKRQCDAE